MRLLAAIANLRLIVTLVVCLARVSSLCASTGVQPSEIAGAYPSTPNHNSVPRLDPERVLLRALELRAKFTRRDLSDAIGMLRRSALLFHAAANPRGEALAEIEAGDTFQMISAFPDARAAYSRALKASERQSDLRCEAYIHLARSYANTGQAEDAQQRLADALATCGRIPESRAQTDLEEVQGETLLFSDDRPGAIAHFERAIGIASLAGDHDGEALARLRLAAAEPSDLRGNLQSQAQAQSALATFLDTGNLYGAARAHSLLGFLTAGSGDLERSKCHCLDALHFFERIGDLDDAAGALNALAFNAERSGNLDETLNDYRRARRLFASAGDYIGEGASIAAISRVLRAKQMYSELASLDSRKRALGPRTLSHSLIGAALIDQAAVEERARRYQEAEESYEKSFVEYQLDGNKRGEGEVRMRQAALETNQDQLDNAIEHLAEALQFKTDAEELADQARIQYLCARVFLKQNQLEKARADIEAAIANTEFQRLQILNFDARAQYFASVHEYYSLYIQVLMQLDKTHPGQRYAQLAFEASEKSKVRALLDLLDGSEQLSSCDRPQTNDAISQDGKPNSVTPNKLDSVSAQTKTLGEVQAAIGDGETTLLEYALDRDQSTAWLIDGQNLTAIDLGPAAKIEESVRMFRKALLPIEAHANEPAIDYLRRRQAARSALRLQSQELARLLLEPVHLPPRKRLLIVPDGPLQYLPFAALSVPDNGSDGVPLIMHYEVSMLPSASALVALRQSVAERSQPDDVVAVFGDPVFQQPGIIPPKKRESGHVRLSRSLRMALQDSLGSQQIPSLPGSRSEALAIQKVFGSARTQLALGYDANREAILGGSIARRRIIHFATHGIIDTRHPEMSGLLLSMFNKQGESQDGYLRLSDVYNLKLSADLVVLSSCESALGKDLGSEGIIGLPRGFLHAGARRVIASLWKVDDEATVTLMRSLYFRLQQGQAPAQALHGAQLDLLKDKRLSDPYYWAAFVLEGDYK